MSAGGEGDPAGIDRWAEALTWHATLRESDQADLTPAVGRRWQEWYAQAENRRVFDHASRLLSARGLYRKRRRPARAQLEEDRYDLAVPVAQWRGARSRQQASKRRWLAAGRWWRLLSGGIGIAAVVVLLAFVPRWLSSGGESASPIIYQTRVGELEQVHLRDGSLIILGGRTKLSVALSARHRSVSLIEGQAWFKVADDPHWPFVVAAGKGRVMDLGTAFLVTRESDRVVVTVTQGAVEVFAQPPRKSPLRLLEAFGPRPALAPIRVDRGEELALGDDGALSSVKPADVHDATAWTRGRLTFDDQPLRYVVETVDRYSLQHITVSSSAGALRFSGIVYEDQIDDWLQGLEAIFPVTVESGGTDVRIELRSSTPEPTTSPHDTRQ